MLKNLIKNSWKNLYQNKYAFLVGESLLHFFMSIIGVGFLSVVFRAVLAAAGQPNLNKDNFGVLFSNPASVLLLTAYALLVAFLTFIEFSFLVNLIESRRTGSGFSLKKVALKTLKNMRSLLGFQMVFFLFYFFLMVPVGNFGVAPTLLSRIKIPDFIINELTKTSGGIILLFGFFAIVGYLNLRLIFTLPLSILNEKSLSANIKKSWSLTKKNKTNLILAVLFYVAIFGFVSFGLLSIIRLLTENFGRSFDPILVKTIFLTISDAINFAFLVLTKVAIVGVLLINLDSSAFKKESRVEQRRRSGLLVGLVAIIFPGAILVNVLAIYGVRQNQKILKISHRGDVSGGAENTISSLEAAHKNGADLVEMDIQLTRDGHFVVIHDTNLARLTGQNLRVRDLTLAEITNLRISDGVFEAKIPTFEEYVQSAKNLGADLLVEIKLNGGESQDLAKKVISEFRRLGISKKYRLMSIDLDLMTEIERLAPEIRTGGTIPLIVGDFGHDLDFYAVEDFSYRERFSHWALQEKREIFVWTINSRDRIRHYLQSDVDGIITDELIETSKIQEELKSERQNLR